MLFSTIADSSIGLEVSRIESLLSFRTMDTESREVVSSLKEEKDLYDYDLARRKNPVNGLDWRRERGKAEEE